MEQHVNTSKKLNVAIPFVSFQYKTIKMLSIIVIKYHTCERNTISVFEVSSLHSIKCEDIGIHFPALFVWFV
jgi:hypothetical protein